VCRQMFSRCGLPNHMRKHKKTAREVSRKSKNKSLEWWDGWMAGYKLAMSGNRARGGKEKE